MLKLTLRKITPTDKKYFSVWWRDKVLLRLTSGRLKLISDKQVARYFSAMLKDKNNTHFMIVIGKKPIGHIVLSKRRNNWRELQVMIGDKKYLGKGYGYKAIELLLRKTKPSVLSKIYLEVRPTNRRAIKVFIKSGFIPVRTKSYPKNKYLPATVRMEQKRLN